MPARHWVLLAVAVPLLAAGCVGTAGEEPEPEPVAVPEMTPEWADRAPGNDTTGREEGSNATQRVGFTDTHVFEGDYEKEGRFAPPLEPGAHAIQEPVVEHLDSDQDGAAIEVGIVRPEVPEDERTPVIVVASPYHAPLDPGRMQNEDAPARDVLLDAQHQYYEAFADRYVPHGYTVALVSARGHGGSGGCSDLLGPMEKADLDQAVTWLGEQAWSNGNVGMVGLSYAGSTAWEVAAQGNPYLETIVPLGSISDVYTFLYRNGSLNRGSLGYATLAYYLPSVAQSTWGAQAAPHRVADAVLCPGTVEGLIASGRSSATLERTPYWEERNHRRAVEANYDGSVFVIHGFQDPRVPPTNVLPWVRNLAEELPVKRFHGPWAHTYPDWDAGELTSIGANPTVRVDFGEILLRWFDHWLKDGVRRDLGPEVQVADQTGQWRSHEAWPPEDASTTAYHLTPGGTLSTEASSETGSVLVGPNEADTLDRTVGEQEAVKAGCSGCAVFASPTLEEPLRFAGLPELGLEVTPQGPGGHVTANLSVQGPEGKRLLTNAQLDLRAADETGADTVTPGTRIQAPLQFEPTDALVRPGQRLVLELHQGSYWEYYPSIPTYPVEVHLGNGASTLELRSFQPAEDAFFEPPAPDG